ncbi:O-antigen polymerase [Pedobacter agri]|uniref:O-antigen polymerase n=1 Tax=Pedobacter agri TaxID=454586 RepID=UPI00292F1F82|nr:O-antigen polymerase [Pedobacter agri]
MTSLLIIVCVVQFIHYIWYIVSVRLKNGFIIDFWAFQLLINNVIFYFMFYPFAKAVENEGATGGSQFMIAKQVDLALIIVTVGYISMWLGKYFYNHKNNRFIVTGNFEIWYLAGVVKRIINSKNALWVLFIIFSPCFLFVAYQALTSGALLGARDSLGESSTERPLYNIAVSVYPIFISILGVLYLAHKKKIYLIGFLMVFGFSFIFGSRGAAFGSLSVLMFFYITSKGRNIGWSKILVMGAGLIAAVLGFGILRSGETKVTGSDIVTSLIYGNTFSDLRDFAWVLSDWNHQLILGKTHFSGLISFIPSGISEFRSEWALGKVTTRIAGLTDSYHGGLRLTIFGESYINFGLIGVIIFSLTYGYFLQEINRKVMYYIKNKQMIEAYAMSLMSVIIFSFMITSGFFAIYAIFLPMIVLTWALNKTYKRQNFYIKSESFRG